MQKHSLRYFLLSLISLIQYHILFGQLAPITTNLFYNYRTGVLSIDSTDPISKKSKKNKKSSKLYYLTGIREGMGVTVNITDINPLKYTGLLNSELFITTSAPPSLGSLDLEGMFKALPKIDAAAAINSPAAENSNNTGTVNPQKTTPSSTTDPALVKKIKMKINCFVESEQAIQKIQQNAKKITQIFTSFYNYYGNIKKRDVLSKTELEQKLKEYVSIPLSTVNWNDTGVEFNISSPEDVTMERIKTLEKSIADRIDLLNRQAHECYVELFSLLSDKNHIDEKIEVQKQLNSEPDLDDLHLTLSQLPATKSEVTKIFDWNNELKLTLAEKVWPEVEKAVTAFEYCRDLSFDMVIGTVMADQDLMVLSIVIKNADDGKEVRKVENIKIHCTGGIRIDYGLGLYLTHLSDREFIANRTSRIQKVAIIKDQSTIDSVLQSVSYSKLTAVSKDHANWGTMGFIQVRSNWNSYLNIGIYTGLGLLLNNTAKPIFSTGATFVLGKVPKVNVNVGIVWGKVNRLNPKYEVQQEYAVDITDATIPIIKHALIFGLTWKLGTLKKT